MNNQKTMIYLLELYNKNNCNYIAYVKNASELVKSGKLKREDMPRSLLKAMQSLEDETSGTI